ncbi:MAG TPA: SusC/RagA family TonB-linked outer membrane protein [Parapedobacter sp.]|uniref:SusC/RagA family TonB-linked outer membrane protein n=1 Tax=Parapedobacter sp. TaxID=1958893 RepID=UPI002CBAB310|nr:SusC/RagA family TonB-linked outer membrane protein [Parapedobacter sp.]HWK58469.1 SusC/RagA family TonB-linked outer membrane protein [Parapedobacter sp.]
MMNKRQSLFIRASYALILSFPCVSTCTWAAGNAPAPAATGSMPDTSQVRKDTVTIEEVEINAGYYTVKDRERTGSIARVTAKEIERQPVLNPLEALKGRMAGVDIQQQNGEIGGGFTVRIRGQNSIRNDPGVNDPLYLIDGVPFTSTSLQQSGGYFSTNPLNTLSPSDIASIEVLKDADATAIYGSRGANGVVLITTKRGQAGKVSLTVDANYGRGNVRKFMDLLDTDQYLEMRREAYANDPTFPMIGNAARDLLVYDQEKYTDWQRVLLGGNADRMDIRASLSGGGADVRYLLSGGFLRQGNVYPGDFGYRRGNGHAALATGSPDDRFQTQLAISYTMDHNDLPNIATNITSLALTLAPNAPDMLDEMGDLNWEGTSYSNNPMNYMRKPYIQLQRHTNAQASISYRIADRLIIKAVGGYNTLFMEEEQLNPASSQNPAYNLNSTFTWRNNRLVTWNVEPQLAYDHSLNWGVISALVGGTLQQMDRKGASYQASGFPNEQLIRNPLAATTLRTYGMPQSQYRYLAAFARVNYALKNRYYLNLTARRDGSSRFGPAKRWGNFGAVGAAWLFTEETQVKSALPWLSFGKIRTSYGATGSDQIDDYGYLATYLLAQANPYQIAWVEPTRIANVNYHWEINRKLEMAMELGVVRDRIRTTVAWYRNRSGNQLVGYPLPATSGFTSVQYNLPATVQNSGWEIDVQAIISKRNMVEWRMAFNVNVPKRTLLSYPNIEASSYYNVYEVGKSMDRNRRYHYLGVDGETGLYRFEDVDGSGTVNTADLKWRDKYRTVYGGLQSSLRLYAVELAVGFQVDNRERLLVRQFSMPGQSVGNQPVGVMERWQRKGDNKPYQQFRSGYDDYYVHDDYMSFLSDASIENTFFVRLTSASISWHIPVEWHRALGIGGLRLSASGQNLWVSDRGNRMDPEIGGLAMPLLRIVTGGIHLTL